MDTAQNDIRAMEILNHIAGFVGTGAWITLSPADQSFYRITVQDYCSDWSVGVVIHDQAKAILDEIDRMPPSTPVSRSRKQRVPDSFASWDQRGGSRIEIY